MPVDGLDGVGVCNGKMVWLDAHNLAVLSVGFING